MKAATAWLLVFATLSGCGRSHHDSTPDAGSPDAGSADAGSPDSGLTDPAMTSLCVASQFSIVRVPVDGGEGVAPLAHWGDPYHLQPGTAVAVDDVSDQIVAFWRSPPGLLASGFVVDKAAFAPGATGPASPVAGDYLPSAEQFHNTGTQGFVQRVGLWIASYSGVHPAIGCSLLWNRGPIGAERPLVGQVQLPLDGCFGYAFAVAFDPVGDRVLAGRAAQVVAAPRDTQPYPLTYVEQLVGGPDARLTSVASLAVASLDGGTAELLVADGAPAILAFDLGAADGGVPLRSIAGGSTGLMAPGAMVWDELRDELDVISDGGLNVYPRNASGDVAPVRTLDGPFAWVARDRKRDELVLSRSAEPYIDFYAADAGHGSAPLRTLGAPPAQPFFAIASDRPRRQLFALRHGLVEVYGWDVPGPPLRTFSLAGLTDTSQLAVDSAGGRLFITLADGTIAEVPLDADGAQVPRRIIQPPAPALAIAFSAHMLWTAVLFPDSSRSVVAIDPDNPAAPPKSTVPIEYGAHSVVADPGLGVFVTSTFFFGQNVVTRYPLSGTGDSNQVLISTYPASALLDPAQGALYVATDRAILTYSTDGKFTVLRTMTSMSFLDGIVGIVRCD